jgi:uncharacterized protein (TIGR01777 family)
MNILLTGSTGLVGTALKSYLSEKGHRIVCLVRDKQQQNEHTVFWDYENKIIDNDKLNNIECVIHLSGENISSKRWSEKQKKKILNSRILSTKFLIDSLLKLDQKPQIFLCASATGYYGDKADELLNEQSEKGTGFLSEVCEAWERSTDRAKDNNIRVVNLRFGVILSAKGGALKKMLLPFQLGVGGRIGSGKQYMPWISLQDTIRAIDFCMFQEEISGPVNIVSPNPVTNLELTKSLGNHLKRPTIFPLPSIVAKMNLGEMAEELLLSSARVEPIILVGKGFKFADNTIGDALNSILRKE